MTDITEVYQTGAAAVEEPAGKDGLLLRDRKGRIRVKDPSRDRALKWFLVSFVALGVAALFFMDLDWTQLWEGILRIPEAVGKLCQVDLSQLDVTFTSLFESIAVAILSTVYSLVGGMILAVFLAKNLTPFKWGGGSAFRGAHLFAGHPLYHLGAADPGVRGLWTLGGHYRHLHFQHVLLCQKLCPVL